MNPRLWPMSLPAAALLVLWATSARAAPETCELTLNAGGHDRTDTPVCVVVSPPLAAKSVVLADGTGKALPAQLTAPGLLSEAPAEARELHFVLPALKRGETLKLTATFSPQAPSEGFAWKNTPGEYAQLSYLDQPVMRYMCRALDESSKAARELTYKVFHHVYNPAGTRLVTKGAGGKYTHHRGVFYGFNRTTYGDGRRADIWHCSGDTHQSHEGFLAAETGPVLGRHQIAVDWHGQGKHVFAKERRELTVYRVPGGRLIEFASRLRPSGGKVRLDGDPQHAGFQFRAAQEVADGDQKLTYYLRPDGKGRPGGTRNWTRGKDECANLPWNAMSFVIDGDRYTAVYVDKPSNPKEARYSERTYGRFGSYFEYDLEEGEQLAVNYRIWVQDGEMTAEQAAALSADFVEPVAVTAR